METLNIERNDQISIDDLVARQAEGFSVLRSAHVGNFSPYNLTLAAAGIPILCVDHTITDVDTNYFPETVIREGEAARIAAGGLVVCRAKVQDASQDNDRFVDEFHLGRVRQAIPQAKVFTNSEYLRANETMTGEIVRAALATSPHLFERLVLSDGRTQKEPGAARMVPVLGIMQLNDDIRAEKTAVIMPNVVDIMANFVIETLQSGRDTQYHLSGPAMVRYIKTLVPDLVKLYEAVRRSASFGQRLPERLNVQLVPTAEARFATTAARRPRLESLLDTVQAAETELAELAVRRKAFFSGHSRTPAETKAFTTQVGREQAEAEGLIAAQAATIPELFIDPGTRGFVTQFDVSAEGGLFVAPINRQGTMAELSKLYKKLLKIRERIRL